MSYPVRKQSSYPDARGKRTANAKAETIARKKARAAKRSAR